MNFSEVNYAGAITVISLIAISIILTAMSIFRFQKIKSLNTQNFNGDEEDEVEDKKYRMFADYSLYANSSFVFSILALSSRLITNQNLFMTIASIISIIITFFLIRYMANLMKQMYPEHNMPSSSDPDHVLDLADDGEKHVILDGLYKSQGLLNFSLITAIILSTIYSIGQENPQTFSIILMAIVLLVVNGKYLLVVRNK
ncbi:DUF3169 family protein [Virgibacillus doumboii]|uniref:DUF3169 family protein n=1 Tax=Virgibacillus doumboii TaxID=2697503 RepID=UPI0013DFF7F9|nr:DUF3169 family protein [Virgibacillus doumboii]